MHRDERDTAVVIGEDSHVAHRRPTPLAELIPTALGKLTRESRDAGFLQAVWANVCGASVGGATRVTRLEAGELEITCASGHWKTALEQEAAGIVERLNAALGQPLVRRLRFVERP